MLGLLVALALAACTLAAGFAATDLPTAESDHLLDGVPGIGGPK